MLTWSSKFVFIVLMIFGMQTSKLIDIADC